MKQTATTTATPYIPAGFSSITPYVIVQGADRFVDFVKQSFGAEELFRKARPDGTIMHAELRIGDSILERSDGSEVMPAPPIALHLYVPDADASYARAMAAGAKSLIAPTDMPYGDREADVTDPFGNNWYIGTRQLGDAVVELGEARGFVSPMPCSMHYYVADADAVYLSAMRAGATSLGEPSDRPYGDRAAEVADPFGNHWFIATQVKDVRYL